MAKAKKLPSGNWRVRVGDGASGRTKSFTAPTKKEAELMAAQYLNNKSIPQNEKTINELIDEYIESKLNILSPTTIAGYRKIKRVDIGTLGVVRLCDLCEQTVQRWVNSMAAKKSPKTVHNAYGLLSAILSLYAPERRFRVALPPKEKHFREFPEVQQIVEAFRGSPIEVPVLLALWLGLRMSEIRAITKHDLANGVLTISSAIVTVDGKHIEKRQTKTYDSARQLRVPPYILSLIDEIPGDRITTLSGQAIYKRFTRTLERNGLTHIRFHDLRHLNASIMLSLGVSDKVAMERGGWSTPTIMRSVYQHTFSADRAAADDQIDAFFEAITTQIATPKK